MPLFQNFLGATAAFTAVQTMTAFAMMTPPVFAVVALADYDLSSGWIGVYPTFVFIAATITAGLGGGLVARYGAIRVSQLGLACCAGGLAMIAIGSLPLAIIGSAFIGLGYGPGAASSSHVLAKLTPNHRQPLMFSIKQSGVPAGGLLAGLIVPPLVIGIGWKPTAIIVAIVVLFLAVLIQALRHLDEDRDRTGGSGFEIMPSLQLLTTHRSLRSLAIWCLPLMSAQFCLSAYMVPFLVEIARLDFIVAGQLLALTQLAGIAGRILWGALAENFVRAHRVLALLCFLTTASTVATALIDSSWPTGAVALVAILFGATAVGWNGVFLAEVARVVPHSAVSRATGAASLVAFTGAAVAPPVFGILITAVGSYAAGYLAIAVVTGLAGIKFLKTESVTTNRVP